VAGFVPYCGVPPAPGALHWNFDPFVIGSLLFVVGASLAYVRLRAVAARDLFAGLFGWLLLSLAFISPLCHLSVALFSARVAQHMAITLVAAPLISLGFVRTDRPMQLRGARGADVFAWASTLGFAAIFWLWHSPLFYDETLRNNLVYWLMHITTSAAALALWAAVFRSRGPLAFLLLFATGAQMSLLGALLTFAAVPLYSVHEFTTTAWGLSWLQDQQLGGLVMWVPAGLLLTVYSVIAFGAALRLDAPLAAPAEENAASLGHVT
jgi:putative membrane protein